ncbi:cytochrome P450 [Parafrankia sp. FMc2]|uniref:cytochrome P450 n=1 Tax=Parafrankia sp. FMc2 TaxID=3233196 RepID=UPI0034D4E22F
MTTVSGAETSTVGPGGLVGAMTATRLADPYPRYREFREAAAFVPDEMAGRTITLVTRLAEASAVLAHPATGHGYGAGISYRGVAEDGLGSLLRADPPDHTRLRRLVGRAFTPAVIEALVPEITSVAHTLLDQAIDQGRIDAVASYARPLPLRVMCLLLGVPTADEELFGGWADALSRGLDPAYLLTVADKAACNTATAAFDDYFRDLIVRRRREPRVDLLSRLVEIHDDGDMLTERELLELCTLLLVAGHETTVNLISGGILALLRNPDQLADVRADPWLVGSAVEETLRHDPPVQFLARTILQDADIAGYRFTRGDGAVIMIGAANRDPAAFAEPDRFLAARHTSSAGARRHLGFGVGIHYCLGAPLARLEADIAFRALLKRTRSITLAEDSPAGGALIYRPHIILRGLASLPLHLSA